jgi:predicted Zn-dependent protease
MRRIAAFALSALLAGSLPLVAAAQMQPGPQGGYPQGGSPQGGDQEAQIGAQVYQQLQQKGEIIPRPNPMYDVLDPIANKIARVANPQYQYPFTFILVHEKQPNAFAVPGGNVYVTDSLMQFVKNQEELGGVLCHETSHDIHHDVVNLNAKAQTQGAMIGILGSLLGVDRSMLGQLSETTIYKMQTSRFSREIESSADLKGSETCAQAGINPHGMVWLFDAFEKAGSPGNPEFISDHPTDEHRIEALEHHFNSNATLFGRYSSDIATGTAIPKMAQYTPTQQAGPNGYGRPGGYGNNGNPSNGYPPNGNPSNGYPPNGNPANGYPPNGNPANGYPPNGNPANGYPPNGNPPGN